MVGRRGAKPHVPLPPPSPCLRPPLFAKYVFAFQEVEEEKRGGDAWRGGAFC